MNIFQKLQTARIKLQGTEIKKTGHNKFAGYYYLTLDDFLPTVQKIFSEVGLCGIVSYTADLATLTIIDMDAALDDTFTINTIKITSPMGSAALKGCHEVQNIGAVETYQRRYLWVTALEICEHDILDATTGSDKPEKLASFKTVAENDFNDASPAEQKRLQGHADVIATLCTSGDLEAATARIQEACEGNEPVKVALSWLISKEHVKLIKAYRIKKAQAEAVARMNAPVLGGQPDFV